MTGVRVVELASWTFVPAAGAVLADWGADVVKLEHPTYGDPQRALVTAGIENPVNHNMEIANRGKRSVAVDLATPGGMDVLHTLLAVSDVFLTNWLPGARTRRRVDVADVRAVNPDIVYVVGSGFGPRGPESHLPGYDGTAYWARGSVAHQLTPPDREWPVNQTPAVGDLPGGMTIAGAIGAALFHRERTGEATVVDASLLGTAVWAMAPGIVQAGLAPDAPARHRDRHDTTNPISIQYRTRDGRFVKLSMLESDRWWPILCTFLDRADLVDDPRFASARARTDNARACVAELDRAFGARTLAEWCEQFATMDAPWGIVQTPAEVLDDPQVVENGYVRTVAHPNGTVFPLVAAPAQFDREIVDLLPCPAHGEHTDEVLAELGYDTDTIIELKVADAVR